MNPANRLSEKLWYAAKAGKFEDVLRLLAKGGVDVNYTVEFGWTPLIYAAANGHIQMVYALFLSGADLHAIDYSEKTAAPPLPRSASPLGSTLRATRATTSATQAKTCLRRERVCMPQ